MEILEIALVFFLIVFWFVWFLISRKRKAYEKRFHELMEERKERRKNHKKLIDEHHRDSLQYGLKSNQKFNNQKRREIPNVPASDRINLDDSYMYQQQPFVANDDYKPSESHSSGFDHGFGGGGFSGGGSGGSWDDSASSYDSGSSSDSTYSND